MVLCWADLEDLDHMLLQMICRVDRFVQGGISTPTPQIIAQMFESVNVMAGNITMSATTPALSSPVSRFSTAFFSGVMFS